MAITLEPRPAVPDARAWTIHGQDTLPRLFRHVVRERGDAVAMREKHLGIWRSITWRQYGERAKHVGLGLVALGFRPRDVVSVIAENCPEWLYTDLGTMSVGGVTNGIYTTDSAKQIEYIVNDSGSRAGAPRTRSSSTRSWRSGRAARSWSRSSSSTWRACTASRTSR
jgi:long-subunit acyl-CoA synthetase (AMP-forming)